MSEETVTITRAEYEELQSLKQKNEELTQQIQYLLEEFNLAQKHRFGASSEKNKVNISAETIYQLGFVFNESEAYADAVIRREAAGETTVKALSLYLSAYEKMKERRSACIKRFESLISDTGADPEVLDRLFGAGQQH